MLPYQFTNDNITVIIDGKPETVQKGDPRFTSLRTALLSEKWEDAKKALSLGGALAQYLAAHEAFTLNESGKLTYRGEVLLAEMQARIEQMASEGKDPSPVLRFYARLQQNPSARSVEQLYSFLVHQNIPIEEDGTFLAYKGVNADLTDKHTGTIDNSPGKVHELARNKISDDPMTPCHFGFHVGALGYASTFAERMVICRVDPADVVCVPYDHSAQKMRVCKYEVIGHYTQPLSSTTITRDEVGVDEDDETDEIDPDNAIGDAMDRAFARGEINADGSPVTPRTEPKAKRTPSSKVKTFGRYDAKKLIGQTIDDLRAYAKKLKIVGASKLPGGKTALVNAITKARRK